LSNLVLALYSLSKIGAIRDALLSPPLNVDKTLLKLQSSTDPSVSAKIKANVNRAQKNLNSDLNEAIEEGAVSTLIAMSLEVTPQSHSSSSFIINSFSWD
jgi:hypothetical protein